MWGIECFVVCRMGAGGESGYSVTPLGWRIVWMAVPGGNWGFVALNGSFWPYIQCSSHPIVPA